MLLIGCVISSMMAQPNFSSHISPQQLINYCMAQNFDGEILTNFQQFVNIFPIKILHLATYQ